jgi:hypothetical protein
VTQDARVDPVDAALSATSLFNFFVAVDIPNTMIQESSDFSLAESTAMDTFRLDMDDVKGEVQEMKGDVHGIKYDVEEWQFWAHSSAQVP